MFLIPPRLALRLGLVAFAGLVAALVNLTPARTQATPGGKVHPRLVNVTTTQCSTCHKALLEGKAHVHPPVKEDCASCHQVAISPAGTRITLVAEGKALCLTCHDGLTAAAEGKLKASHAPVGDSCTACHDPHSSATPKLLVAPTAELCATCHEVAALQAGHGGQLTPATTCTVCHAPHGSANPRMLMGAIRHAPFADKSCDGCHRPPVSGRVRLRARGEALCSACHGDIAAAPKEGGSLHPALRAARGGGGCTSCHAPHMSTNAKLLLVTGPALCAKCHADIVKAALAKSGHPPAAEDCTTCHDPHRAPRARLLKEEPKALCQGCHDPGDGPLKKAHLGADLASLECISCHSPHGTGNRKSLARHLHPPVADGCDTCHEGSVTKLVENGESALCLMCHEDIGKRAAAAKVPHPALEVAHCKDCHNPHASPQEKLVKLPGGGPCLACHDAQGAGAGEVQHGAITTVGCRACHEPHGGDNPKLLREVGNALCLGCHDPQKNKPKEGEATVKLAGRFEVPASLAKAIRVVLLSPNGQRGHPTPDHRVSGPARMGHASHIATTWKDELACLACHDPHKGRARQLFRGNVIEPTEVCLRCHPR